MTGYETIAQILKIEGVERICCYPNNELLEAASKVGIKPVMFRHERGAVMAAELGMLLGAFVKDVATIFTIWKTAGIILFAPVFVFLFPQIPQWVGNIFPSYYILHPIVQISQFGGGWSEIATNTLILIGIDLVLLALVLFTLRRKQYAIISA